MNHNEHNLEVGDWVLLDDTLPLVRIFSLTEGKIFAEVGSHSSPIDTWRVMTLRLKPKPVE